ncbi:GDA1/CD39 (nucleoside phosphatase) family domain-containing protein [Hirsutella rhossiliensis]|uniref:GDA1/CD39 (Nucleoside phosphatase) family domain-containing protein n=1 Tax=Hirsutella rhossiliensis TaxID=111463 RepID=A0A9P8SGC2_9HYPO|nr:GDA1/CD39 (nucleoside phosphatase) family domain-containing protein [Hirsutella rhossiliensis]KAH0960320.1 GDA1/CD39 (nucleoside phosphatase) family domain-containing protein [Hirsutella rhossiliensis]
MFRLQAVVGAAQYGVILDAGSSGTRVYVYKWKHPARAIKHASVAEAHRLPRLKLKKSEKIHPGVSTFAEDVASVGPDHLESLMKVAISEVPAAKIPETPIFLMATAGVRFLPRLQQTALLRGICSYLRASTEFHLPDCKSHIKVISGETEGLYGWIATNYLLGGFDHPGEHAHGKSHHTYGFLDMGGASAQIAFAPNTTETSKHANDLKLVRMRHLDGSPEEYKVFTATWLGFGANKARTRYIESLQDSYDNSDKTQELPDPCMPRGLRTTLSGEPAVDSKTAHGQVLVGTGAFDECLRKTFPLLRKDAPCEDHPCLLNGQHVPVIDFDVNHFVGVSEYWHATHGVFGKENTVYDIAVYQRAVLDFCNRDWSAIEADLKKKNKKLERKTQTAREACFKASWLINVLHDGIGIPRVTLEGTPSTDINATKDAVGTAKGKGFLDPFQPVDKIEGVEIPPNESSSFPVGFGSNVGSGTPSDFEHAGSIPLLPPSPNDTDDDGPVMAPSKSTSGLLALILLLLLAAFLLRRPEWRRRLAGMIRRQRRSGAGRKPARGVPSFVNKLLGRNSTAYERIVEEADVADLELGDVDSEDHDYSDGSDSSRAGSRPVVQPPRLNLDRSEDLQPPSEMDRNGLVIRTESRERLAPTLQMLNAGRRSRVGSPTRLKSPLMTPREDL